MKAPSSHMIALVGFWLAAATSAAGLPPHAANDNTPAPHHGGEHEPQSVTIRPERKKNSGASAEKR